MAPVLMFVFSSLLAIDIALCMRTSRDGLFFNFCLCVSPSLFCFCLELCNYYKSRGLAHFHQVDVDLLLVFAVVFALSSLQLKIFIFNYN